MTATDLMLLMDRLDDPLAEAMLSEGEPNVHRAWSLVPPLVGPTFLGGRDISPKVLVAPDASVADLGIGPLAIAPGDLSCYGDAVPACLEAVGTDDRGADVHRLLLAASDEGGPAIWWMEQAAATTFRRSAGGRWESVAPEAFERALTAVITREAEEIEVAAELHVPELFRSCARLSLLRALNAFEGRHPKYGWGGYEGAEHDAFPPTIIALGHALIDVSLLTRAEELVGHWLAVFVTADGAFDYYGPALSEYGMILDLAARLARAARDRSWYAEAEPVLRRIGDRLMRLREEQGGLVPGLPEADYHRDSSAGQTLYYGNNLWCARGLLSLSEIAAEPRYEAAARDWYRDAQMVLHADTTEADGEPFVPWAAGEQTPPPTLTADRDASYANYRFYPEMLSSRLLGAEQAQVIFELRRRRGGEFAGCTRFSGWLDNWPAAEVGLAMLEYGEFAAAQRLLVGHIALCHAVGHQTAYEQVSILPGNSGWREPKAGFCVPAQLVAPRLLRNLLVYEARDTLWLNPAGFRSWIGEGYGAEQVTTRWGRVSFRIEPEGDGVMAEVDARAVQPQVPVRLRLQRRDGRPLTQLEVNGHTIEVTGDSVVLPPASGLVSLIAR